MKKIKVYLNTKKDKRRIVKAELLETRATTVLVRLPDGTVIVRKKNRDVVKEEGWLIACIQKMG
ncbi:hypothetical protein LCGC14_2769790 [marine sediment metagenome]|uniref:Uncharacterized protein n=1 Tax=marine sediment metagenome TaxID=412755 RepID=A0A0F8V9J1_9ZZZZ